MAQLVFSQSLVETAIITTSSNNSGKIFMIHGTNNTMTTRLSGGAADSVLLRIYRGARPAWSEITTLNNRSADLLITFGLPASTGAFENMGFIGGALRVRFAIRTTPVSASASGLATWFVLNPATTSTITVGALMGDVGGAGSGADLELVSPNIVSGEQYVCSGLYFNFPQVWNF
jgi:hypothetical protein